jgi:HEAT repeat protein
MSLTFKQLKTQLSDIEPTERTYSGIGVSEISLLNQLLGVSEDWLAARAIYALARLPENEVMPVLTRAVTDRRPEVRIALASISAKLEPEHANDILLKLLSDNDVGVRKFAVRSVSREHSDNVRAKLQDMVVQDNSAPIRAKAEAKLRDLNSTIQ